VQNPGGTIAPGVQAPGLSGPGTNPILPSSGPVTPGATSPATGNVSTPNSRANPPGSAGGTGARSTGVGSRSTPGSGIPNPNATTLPGGTAVPGSTTNDPRSLQSGTDTPIGVNSPTGTTGGAAGATTGATGSTTGAANAATGTTGATTGAANTANGLNPVNRGQLGFSVRSGAGDGLVVNNVNTGGLAQQAGLLSGDQIVSINGNAVNSQADISTALRQSALSGNNVLMGVMRNGQLQSLTINAGSGTSALGQASGGANAAGTTANAANLTSGATQQTTAFRGLNDGLTFTPSQSGLTMNGVSASNWASQAGFQEGDQLVSIDGQPISSQTQFPTQLQSAIDRNGFANVIVNRNGTTVPLRVSTAPGGANLNSQTNPGDFNSLAGDFGTTFSSASTNLQNQLTQLNSLNQRIDALRTALANPPADALGRAQLLDQLRTLRTELNGLNGQSSQQFFQQLDALRTRLNDFNPTFNQGTPGSTPTATVPSSSLPSGGSSSSSSSSAPSTTRSLLPSGVSPTPLDRTVIGGQSSDTRP
jgi:membrane-associated protease RseP (regulator of RpoE activity)